MKNTQRNINEVNKEVNYKNDVNAKHAESKQVFKTPIYVIKNADNDVFKLSPSHIQICNLIMANKELQNTFIKNVRRSPNGETNLYYIRQMLYKVDKLGFTKAIEAIKKAKAKSDAKKAAKVAEVAEVAEVAPKAKKAA